MSVDKKYIVLESDSIEIDGSILHRIKALRSFGNVESGSLGGYIESEYNLSHSGNSWVYERAYVWGNAIVNQNAKVYGLAHISGNTVISEDAVISGDATITGNIVIRGNSFVHYNVELRGLFSVQGHTTISGSKIFLDDDRVIENQVLDGVTIDEVYRKYEILEKYTVTKGIKCFQIRALRNIGSDIKAGDLGGFIDQSSYLDHRGDSWIYFGSAVYKNSRIIGNAKIKGESIIFSSCVLDNSIIINSKITNSTIGGDVVVDSEDLDLEKLSYKIYEED